MSEKTINRFFGATDLKATVTRIHQHGRADSPEMHEKIKKSEERTMRPKEEAKGDLGVEKYCD